MAETAHADDGDLGAFGDAPGAQRRVGGDAGAQQWRDGGGVEVLGDVEGERLGDDDGLRVTTGGRAPVVTVDAVVGTDGVRAVVLLALLAPFALTARVDEATDTGTVADLELGDVGTDLGDAADDLVAGHHGVIHRAPLAADGVDVGVADSGVLDLDADVVGAQVAALDGAGLEGLVGGNGLVAGNSRSHDADATPTRSEKHCHVGERRLTWVP